MKILPKELEHLKEFVLPFLNFLLILRVHETDFQVHFGLTSQDINNVAIPLALKEALENEYKPRLEREVLKPLRALAEANMNTPMLARTHGQPVLLFYTCFGFFTFPSRTEFNGYLEWLSLCGKFRLLRSEL